MCITFYSSVRDMQCSGIKSTPLMYEYQSDTISKIQGKQTIIYF